jgi:MFS family permease
MEKPLRWYDAITTNIYFFALSSRSNVLTPLLLPLLVEKFMGQEVKGASYGNLRLYSLMAALLVQAVVGLISDRSTSRFGKRRPFVLGGSLLDVLVLLAIGYIGTSLAGLTGYTALFVAVIASMLTTNIAHAAVQGLIPDIVPSSKRGFYSGIKALFEVPLPLIFVPFVVSPMISSGNYMGAIFTLISIVLVCTLLTMFVKEKPQRTAPFAADWQSIGRLVLMTLFFTLIIVLLGRTVSWALPTLLGNHQPLNLVLVGVVGLVCMLIAVGMGVIVSVRVGLGKEAKDHTSFTWWIVNRLAFLVGATNLSSFVLYFIQERFPAYQGQAAAKPTSLLIMMVGLALLVSSLPAGWLTDRFGTRKLLLVSGILALVGSVVVLLAPGLPVMYVGGVIVGLGIGIFYSANWALGTSLVPKEQAGRYLGLSNLAGAGAGAIGAYIGGPIGDSAGFTLLMAIYGCLFLFSTLALLRIKTSPVEPAQVAL